MFNRKELKVTQRQQDRSNPYKKDIIVDPKGQWKHPGQNTRIPGNNITMSNVPYPVWAQPNVGPGMMMQPGQDYNFPGADYVDEFPMAQDGAEVQTEPTQQQGGSYIELELDDDEIEQYRSGGYIVEDMSRAQVGTEVQLSYQQKAMELGAGMVIASDPVAARTYVIDKLGYDPEDSRLIGNIKVPKKTPKYVDQVPQDVPTLPQGETLLNVAQTYIGGPDLGTVANRARIKKSQDFEKKEAVTQHYYAKMKEQFPGYTIEKARKEVNTGEFGWEDYYNRERLWDHGPDKMRGMTDAEWEEEHGPQAWQDKLRDIIYNPMTAAGFLVRGQEIPDYMQRDMDRGTFGQFVNGSYITGRNPLDMITDVTPIGAIHSADRIIEKAGNDISGDFWTMETAFDAANTVFHANMLTKANRYSKGLAYGDDFAGTQAANYATRNKILGDPDLLNTGFKPLQKTLGKAEDIAGLADETQIGTSAAQRARLNKPSVSPSEFLENYRFAKKLQSEGVLPTNIDPKLFGRFPNLANNASKAAIKKHNTSYRAVTPDLNNASLDDLMSMANHGYDINDPNQVAEFMSTVVPHRQYGYNATSVAPGAGQFQINTGRYPSMEDALRGSREYGTHLTEVRPPMDFSTGSKQDWLKKFVQDRLFLNTNPEAYKQPYTYPTGIEGYTYPEGSIVGRPDAQNWQYVGTSGNKILEAVRTQPIPGGSSNPWTVRQNMPSASRSAAAKYPVNKLSSAQMSDYLVRNKIISGDTDLMRAGFNPLQKMFSTDIKLKRIADEGVAAGLSPKQIAQQQMSEVGITTLQREGYTPLISDALYYGINPRGTGWGTMSKAAKMPFNWAGAGLKKLAGKTPTSPAGLGARDDAWGMFLGKPQKANTFSLADSAPTPGVYGAGELNGVEKFAINKIKDNPDILSADALWDLSRPGGGKGMYPHQAGPFFSGEKAIYPVDNAADVMGQYNLRRTNPNTLEYNDLWDLSVPGVPNKISNAILGKKFLSTGQAQFDDLAGTLHGQAGSKNYTGVENLGDFVPKTEGTGYEFDIPDDALFGGYEMKSLNAEDWLNEKGPALTKSFINKFKRKSKKGKPNETEPTIDPATGTYEEIAVSKIINDAIKDMPFQGVKEHPFAGTNLFSPLNIQTGINPPIYKLPKGISQQQLDSFVSQINIGEVPITSIEAVFGSLAKLNPELNSIKGVPKGDIIGYMSGHMPIDEIESTHRFMTQQSDAAGLPITGKSLLDAQVSEIGDKFQTFKQNVPDFTSELMGGIRGGTNAAATEANQWLDDWINHPNTQNRISKMFDVERGYKSEQYAAEIPTYEGLVEHWKNLQAKDQTHDYSRQIKEAEDNLSSAREQVAGAPSQAELEALNFKPSVSTFPLGKQLKSLIKGEDPIHAGNLGVHIPAGQQKGAWVSRKNSSDYDRKVSTGIHEGTHQWTKGNTRLHKNEINAVASNLKEKAWKLTVARQKALMKNMDPKKVLGGVNAYYAYLASPTEVHARIMQLRKHFDLKPGQDVTPKMAHNILTEVSKGTTPVTKNFTRLFDDAGSFANLFNSLRVMVPIAGAAGLGALSQEQDGGYIEMELSDKEIEEYRKGGYTVDIM